MWRLEIRKVKQKGTVEKVRRSQVRFRNVLEELDPERLVKSVYEAEMEGRRE